MKWPVKRKRKPLYFADAARFNWTMDTDQELREGLSRLVEQYHLLTEKEYTSKMLILFQQAGLELDAQDLKMLLALRQTTDQLLLQHKDNEDAGE